jgi:hypothetical protein
LEDPHVNPDPITALLYYRFVDRAIS